MCLWGLPLGIPIGIVSFALARGCLRRDWRGICLLAAVVLTVGAVYGALRFGGMIPRAGDNAYSSNWFDASWQDDGFQILYGCGICLIGIAAAALSERMERKGRS